MKKPPTKSLIIGCKHAWGNPIPQDTEKYCSDCTLETGRGECLTDIMCGERCYIIKRVSR